MGVTRTRADQARTPPATRRGASSVPSATKRTATVTKRTGAAPAKKAKKMATAGAGAPTRAADRPSGGALPTRPFDGALEPAGSPASRRALRNQGRRTMRKLLDAAMEAFDRRGYHATRVNDVVEIAKTSHGTFYLYFSNKEDLLRALVAEAAAEAAGLYASLTVTPEGGAGWDDVRGWVAQYSALWVRYAPLLRAWTDLASTDPELGAQVRQAVNAMCGALTAQMDATSRHAGIEPDTAGMAVIAMLDRFHYLREFVGHPVDDAALDTLATIVYRGLFDGGTPGR
jgi:AcrR family transcriptional regulator